MPLALSSVLMLFLALGLLTACGGGATNDNELAEGDTADVATAEPPAELAGVSAVSIWPGNVGVYKTVERKRADWLVSIYLGDRVELTGTVEETTDDNGRSTKHYEILYDDKTGFVPEHYIAIDGTPMAVTEELDIYKQPKLSALTDRKFSPIDVVAVLQVQDDWLEVKGRRNGSNWMETVWVRNRGLSSDEVDLAVAILVHKARAEETNAKKLEWYNRILDNNDLSGSVFADDVRQLADDLSESNVTELDNSGF